MLLDGGIEVRLAQVASGERFRERNNLGVGFGPSRRAEPNSDATIRLSEPRCSGTVSTLLIAQILPLLHLSRGPSELGSSPRCRLRTSAQNRVEERFGLVVGEIGDHVLTLRWVRPGASKDFVDREYGSVSAIGSAAMGGLTHGQTVLICLVLGPTPLGFFGSQSGPTREVDRAVHGAQLAQTNAARS
ncbi:MAG: hypothetical protein ABIP17_17055 [Ilumatobacteraceae bacterium]